MERSTAGTEKMCPDGLFVARVARVGNQQGLAMLPSATEVPVAKDALRYAVILS